MGSLSPVMNFILQNPWFSAAAGACAFLLVFSFRRLFNDLKGFPGPKLAGVTRFYTAYYDMIKDGAMVDHIGELHHIYGPVVRTAPKELHFNDPRAFADIYNYTNKFEKDPYFYGCFAVDGCSFGSIDPRKARTRRALVSPFFSRKAITKLEYLIQAKVDILVQQLIKSQDPVNLASAYRSTTLDIITSYCYGRCYGATSYPNFRHPILDGMEATFFMAWLFKHFRFTIKLLMSTPPWLLRILSPKSYDFFMLRLDVIKKIDGLLKDSSSLDQAEHETIYHHMLTPQPEKGHNEIPPRRSLIAEAINLLFAGSDTIRNACVLGTFHVLYDPTIRSKLQRELDDAWPDSASSVSYETLEKLPYLTAVIKESLRLSHGVVSALPRVVGPNSATIAGVEVPAGTVVSMGATFMHLNEDVFPNPLAFSPERWLQPNSAELDNFLVAFSKGPRSCLGVNLAWCEMYLILGNVFKKLDMVLHETSAEDFKFVSYFLPVYRGRPLRAIIKARTI